MPSVTNIDIDSGDRSLMLSTMLNTSAYQRRDYCAKLTARRTTGHEQYAVRAAALTLNCTIAACTNVETINRQPSTPLAQMAGADLI